MTTKKTYVTFGSAHRHEIGGVVFDTKCVAVVNGDRDEVFRIFGPRFCSEHSEEHWESVAKDILRWSPRGCIEVPEVPERGEITNA